LQEPRSGTGNQEIANGLLSRWRGAATGEGGDRIVCDDPNNVNEVESDGVRKSTNDWFDVVMSTRVNDPKTTAKVVVMQRCHEQDLSGHLLERGGWEHLCLPAEYEGSRHVTSIGWSDPRKEHAELLWPERFGPMEMEDLKRSLGSYAAAGQLQQRPSPAEGGMIKRHWSASGRSPAPTSRRFRYSKRISPLAAQGYSPNCVVEISFSGIPGF